MEQIAEAFTCVETRITAAFAEWLITAVVLGIIGLLIVLAPGKQTPVPAAAA